MAQDRKYFGTDGIRGRVGDPLISPDFVMRLGWAAGRTLAASSGGAKSRVLIGKDTRISGYMFESALEAGLSAAGVDILLLGPMPTPAVAYLTRTFHAQAGIVISASHNAYHDNGIKFFSEAGTKLPDEMELQIEAALDEPMGCVASRSLGKAKRITDAAGRYIEFCKSTIGFGTILAGLKIVVDCGHGATYHIAPNVLRELGADVHGIHIQPDGININENCGATDTRALEAVVVQQGADAGIALDGDGDRIIMVDAAGSVVDGDELLYIIARERWKRQRLAGAVVGTQMSNLGLEQAIRAMGLDFHRAKVGDRYVMEMMKEGGWPLGGESSGHIICLDLTTTGDGIVSALQVLEAMVQSGKSLADLRVGMTKLPQELINVKSPAPGQTVKAEAVQEALIAAEQELGASGRILLRPSGTEPLVRVMVEGADPALILRIAQGLADVVEAAAA